MAKKVLGTGGEAGWRTATGRAYYALFLEDRDALDRWGFAGARRDQAHRAVRLKILYARDDDLKRVAVDLELLGHRHNAADYQVDSPGRLFSNGLEAVRMIGLAEGSIELLDRIDTDDAVRSEAIEAIRSGSA